MWKKERSEELLYNRATFGSLKEDGICGGLSLARIAGKGPSTIRLREFSSVSQSLPTHPPPRAPYTRTGYGCLLIPGGWKGHASRAGHVRGRLVRFEYGCLHVPDGRGSTCVARGHVRAECGGQTRAGPGGHTHIHTNALGLNGARGDGKRERTHACARTHTHTYT